MTCDGSLECWALVIGLGAARQKADHLRAQLLAVADLGQAHGEADHDQL